jgi:ankyrin repeat domain-containing protein 50
LRKCLTIGQLKKQLETLPTTLEETYDQILLRIEESHRQSALKILQWLAFAAMPVTIEAAAEALAVDLSMEPCYNPDHKLFDPQDVMILCSSLVTKVTVSPDDMLETLRTGNAPYFWVYRSFLFEDSEREAIRLAHLSVKDYLVSDRIKLNKAHQFAIDASLANTFIAQTCLVYLLQPAFASGYCDENGILTRNIEWPLFRYAVHFWPFHVKRSGEILNDTTWHLLQRFFGTKNATNGGNFASWAVALTPNIALEEVQCTQPLYYAASFGITSLIRKLLDSNPEIAIDAVGGRHRSPPLQAAAFRDHPAAVKLLLEAGADPMGLNEYGDSCLFWAIAREHVEVQDLLESYGATLRPLDRHLLNRIRNASRFRKLTVTPEAVV